MKSSAFLIYVSGMGQTPTQTSYLFLINTIPCH